MNRAYYAMFYSVLALLQSIGKVAGKHTGAIGLFDTEFVLKGTFPKDLSRDLHRAFDARQLSDYQPARLPTPEDAREHTARAQRFVEAVERYLRLVP